METLNFESESSEVIRRALNHLRDNSLDDQYIIAFISPELRAKVPLTLNENDIKHLADIVDKGFRTCLGDPQFKEEDTEISMHMPLIDIDLQDLLEEAIYIANSLGFPQYVRPHSYKENALGFIIQPGLSSTDVPVLVDAIEKGFEVTGTCYFDNE